MLRNQQETTIEPYLDTYHFYAQEWDGYDHLSREFEWVVPAQFNMATYLCDRWAEADADRVAGIVVDPDDTETKWTYGQLREDANRLANYFAAQGIERGDRISVSGAQKFEFLISHLAAWKLGAISVPLSILFGPDGLRYRLDDSGATAFVADEANVEALRSIDADLEELDTILTVGDAVPEAAEVEFWTAMDSHSAEFDTEPTDAEATATIMYTSGTTGPPKGVVHPHRTLLGVLPGYVTSGLNMDPRKDDVGYTPVEWSWVGTLYNGVLPALYYGIPQIADADPRYDPERMLDLIERYDVTGIGGPSTVYRMLMQVPDAAERYNLSSLRVVIQGGESLGQSIVDWFHQAVDEIVVHEVYGQTEAPQFLGDCEALGVEHRPGHMGRPMPGHSVDVVDSQETSPVDVGNVDELAVRYEGDPVCFGGFWNAPAKTDERIQDGWLLTEDLAVKSEDGYFSFHSRSDDVIISSGYRIGPTEIEECLAGHEAVGNAGVIGVPHEMRGEIPKAFVVLNEGYEPTDDLREDLQAHVKAQLAKHEYPRAMEFVDGLPMTTTAKVRRRDLREREGLIEVD